jgi:hypothetical protein
MSWRAQVVDAAGIPVANGTVTIERIEERITRGTVQLPPNQIRVVQVVLEP